MLAPFTISRMAQITKNTKLIYLLAVCKMPLLKIIDNTRKINQPQRGIFGACQITTLPLSSVNPFLISGFARFI
jgi:hypothetical protein